MSNYQIVKLLDVCQIESGGTPSSSNPSFWDGDISWATLVDVKNKYTNSTKRRITQEGLKNSSAKILPIGTVLFSSRATIGEVSITNIELATNQGFKNFICDSNKILAEYLYYVLKKEAKNIADSAPSTTFKEISKSKLGQYEIPLPSIDEQKKIIKTLDLASTLLRKRSQSIELMNEYLKSTFLEMFGDPVENLHGWSKLRLQELCIEIADIDHNMPKATDSGFPFISAKDLLDDGTISFKEVKYISEKDYLRLSRKIKPKKGDIIYSRIGAKLGKARIVNVDFDFLASYSCCTIRPRGEKINTLFLNHLLNTPSLLKQALKDVRAIGVPDLGMDKIRAFEIILPPMKLQTEFAEIATKVEHLKQKMLDQSGELNIQFQSLTQRSFSLN